MKILKIILLSILGLALLVLIIAFFVPREMNVQKSVVINRPVEQVFDYVKMLKNQNEFSVWMTIDPKMKKAYEGVDGTVGAITKWDSQHNDVGQGEQEIIGIEENTRIDYELRFIRPFESTAQAYMITESTSANQTKVTWGFHSESKYPMNLVQKVIGLEKMLGDQLQQGLDTLKGQMEE
ncbi:SRPBCC family protein [Echinicola soli]|uniref:SRPBCC family protein n=1 Tax=Echinicola soli TaxID=2591634 RepID=A0A514CLI8_9BACT|nr:SRPBCC family protein [Echinicola soli]QDH80660.1 SRPBCC family protein [Echinicola soli]